VLLELFPLTLDAELTAIDVEEDRLLKDDDGISLVLEDDDECEKDDEDDDVLVDDVDDELDDHELLLVDRVWLLVDFVIVIELDDDDDV